MSFLNALNTLRRCGLPDLPMLDDPIDVWTRGPREQIHVRASCDPGASASQLSLNQLAACAETHLVCRPCETATDAGPVTSWLAAQTVALVSWENVHRLAGAIGRDDPARDPSGFIVALCSLRANHHRASESLARMQSPTDELEMIRSFLQGHLEASRRVCTEGAVRVEAAISTVASDLGIDVEGELGTQMHWLALPRPWVAISSVTVPLAAQLAVAVYGRDQDAHAARDHMLIVVAPAGVASAASSRPSIRSWSSDPYGYDLGPVTVAAASEVAALATTLLPHAAVADRGGPAWAADAIEAASAILRPAA